MNNKDRLRRLEEEAAKASKGVPGDNPGWPHPWEFIDALNRDIAALGEGRIEDNERELLRSYGWSEARLDEREAYIELVRERVEESGLSDEDAFLDRMSWLTRTGRGMDAWEEYPGPYPTWWPGGEGRYNG